MQPFTSAFTFCLLVLFLLSHTTCFLWWKDDYQNLQLTSTFFVNAKVLPVDYVEKVLAQSQDIQIGNILSVFPSVAHSDCFYFSHSKNTIMRVNMTSGDVDHVIGIFGKPFNSKQGWNGTLISNPSSIFVSTIVKDGIVYDQVYFIDKGIPAIRKFDTMTQTATTLVMPTQLNKPLRTVVNRGMLYFADSNRIMAFNLTLNELRIEPVATFNLTVSSMSINLDSNEIFVVLGDDSLYIILDEINAIPKYLFSMNVTVANGNNNQGVTTNQKTIIRTSTIYQDQLFAFCYQRIFQIDRNGTSKVMVGSGKDSNIYSYGPALEVELGEVTDMYIGSNIFIAYTDAILTIINGNLMKIFSESGLSLDGLPKLKYGFSDGMEKITFSPLSRNLYVTDGNIIRNISLTTGTVTSLEGSSTEISSSLSVIYTELDLGEDESLYVTSIDPETSITSLAVIKNKTKTVLIDSSKKNKQKDGMDAINAVLDTPLSIFKGQDGNIYFTESGNHMVRKITPEGKIHVLVGISGQSGYSGDGGLGVNAQLSTPKGLCIVNNVMYIVDSRNGLIRNLSLSTGIIDTFAGVPTFTIPNGGSVIPDSGKPRREIQMNVPSDIKYSANSDTLFVSDTYSHRVLRFPLKENRGYLLAGVGYQGYIDGPPLSSAFNQPYGLLCVDKAQKITTLYIVDSANHRIRKIILQNGIPISNTQTIAGRSDGYAGDGGSALSASFLYPTFAEYYIDPDGNELLLISDTFNNRIRIINVNSNFISTAIGVGVSGFNRDTSPAKIKLNSPKGLFVDGEMIYFLDSRNHRVLGLNMTGEDSIRSKQITFISGGYGRDNITERLSIAYPYSVVVDDLNVVYFTDDLFSNIRKLERNGVMSTIAGDGDVGRGTSLIQATKSSLNKPTGLLINENHEVVFCDMLNDRIRKINKNGIITDVASTGLEGPFSPVFNLDHQIIVLHKYGRRISLVRSDEQVETILNLEENAQDIEFDPLTGSIIYCTRTTIYTLTPVCKQNGYILNSNFTSCLPVCYGKVEDDACGFGSCIGYNECECKPGYTGQECDTPICFGLTNENKDVCNGRGKCKSFNSCKCASDLYLGDNCETATCYGKINSDACGGPKRGNCTDIDKCSCNTNRYTGDKCQFYMCHGVAQNDPNVCSGHGTCNSIDDCKCFNGFSGDSCENNDSIMPIIVPIILTVVFLGLLILLVSLLACLCRKYGKQKKIIGDADSLSKQLLFGDDYKPIELQDPESNPQNDFIIPIGDLDLRNRKRLGKGGQGMVIESMWKGINVAVKVFEMDTDVQDQEFINEVKILVKLRHPNITSFYGVSMLPNKGFIVMERLDKSLVDVIHELEKETITMTFDRKIQIFLGIARGIEYLHTLKPTPIVHRDLKPGNVLLTKDGVCKLCDFGLSRKMSEKNNSIMTHLIGTHNFMSPQLINGTIQDAKTCDVYAFGIIMWQLLFECQDAYSYTEPRTLKRFNLDKERRFPSTPFLTNKICQENLRPLIPFQSKEECFQWCKRNSLTFDQFESSKVFNICELIENCWQVNEEQRPPISSILNSLLALTTED